MLTMTPVLLGIATEPLASIPNPRLQNGTWVSDMPGALRPESVAALNARIGAFERASGIEVAVVVIRSLDGASIEEAATNLFTRWGIGKKGRDNGLLLLRSTGDRRVRVEVGYGLEGVLNDSKVGAILDTYVIPKFKSGEFDEGSSRAWTRCSPRPETIGEAAPWLGRRVFSIASGAASFIALHSQPCVKWPGEVQSFWRRCARC